MGFRSKGGEVALFLRLEPGENKISGIKRLSQRSWIFPDEWDEVIVKKDKLGEFLILKEDANSIGDSDQEGKADSSEDKIVRDARVPGARRTSMKEHREYVDKTEREYEKKKSFDQFTKRRSNFRREADEYKDKFKKRKEEKPQKEEEEDEEEPKDDEND